MYRGIVGGAGIGTGTAVAGANLAITGSPVATWTLLGIVLLVTGTLLTRVAARRRRTHR